MDKKKKNENSNDKTRRKEEKRNTNHEYITDYSMLINKKRGQNGLSRAGFLTRPDAYGKIISRTKSGRITWRLHVGGCSSQTKKTHQKEEIRNAKCEYYRDYLMLINKK